MVDSIEELAGLATLRTAGIVDSHTLAAARPHDLEPRVSDGLVRAADFGAFSLLHSLARGATWAER